MSKPMIRIHNIETDEVIDREMTDEEFQQYEIERIEFEQSLAQEEAKLVQRQALLNRLGITEEEAQLLLS